MSSGPDVFLFGTFCSLVESSLDLLQNVPNKKTSGPLDTQPSSVRRE